MCTQQIWKNDRRFQFQQKMFEFFIEKKKNQNFHIEIAILKFQAKFDKKREKSKFWLEMKQLISFEYPRGIFWFYWFQLL